MLAAGLGFPAGHTSAALLAVSRIAAGKEVSQLLMVDSLATVLPTASGPNVDAAKSSAADSW